MRLRARISGHVQGVGFRWFVSEQAHLLGCTGYTRNNADGTVDVVAEGSQALLEELLRRLQRGPAGAGVAGVEAEWRESTGEFAQFQIRH